MPCSIEVADAVDVQGPIAFLAGGHSLTTVSPTNNSLPDAPTPQSHRTVTRRLAKCRNLATNMTVLAGVMALALTGRAWLAARAASLAIKPADPLPTTVRVARIEPEVVAAGLHYSAAVKEIESVELSFRVGGTVENLYRVEGPGGKLHPLHEGDRVVQGTMLACLDTSDYRRAKALAGEKLATAEARLAQVESDAELAAIERRRVEQLVRRGAATDAELDTTRSRQASTAAAVAGARRDVESARIGLEQAEANLSYCTLTSPLERGTVAARYIDAGERVAANQPAFMLLDLSSVVIAFGVPDTLVGRLSLGQPIAVACDALPGERFTGVIHKIASAADPKTRTYAVEVRVDKPKGLRPGMIATVHLEHEVRAHLLPLMAIAPRPESSRYDVFRIVDEAGQTAVRRAAVEIEDVIDNRVAIKIGDETELQPGDRVVITGTHRLYDGQPVSIEE
jgi:RND family efflux transporter MFP subunit